MVPPLSQGACKLSLLPASDLEESVWPRASVFPHPENLSCSEAPDPPTLSGTQALQEGACRLLLAVEGQSREGPGMGTHLGTNISAASSQPVTRACCGPL